MSPARIERELARLRMNDDGSLSARASVLNLMVVTSEDFASRVLAEMEKEGCIENWISYGSEYFSAKELTVLPGKTVTIVDAAAYGLIVLQGHGKVGALSVESPAMIRFGQMTEDELFVTADTAKTGVVVSNESNHDELVMLKHFGPGNPEMPART